MPSDGVLIVLYVKKKLRYKFGGRFSSAVKRQRRVKFDAVVRGPLFSPLTHYTGLALDYEGLVDCSLLELTLVEFKCWNCCVQQW